MANQKISLFASIKKTNRWVLALIILGLLLAGFFGFRAVRSFTRLHQSGLHPGMTDVEAIRGWMTIPYIARMYDVPPPYLFNAINIPPQEYDKKSLAEINRAIKPGQSGYVLEAIKKAILQFRAEHPSPPPPPQPPSPPPAP